QGLGDVEVIRVDVVNELRRTALERQGNSLLLLSPILEPGETRCGVHDSHGDFAGILAAFFAAGKNEDRADEAERDDVTYVHSKVGQQSATKREIQHGTG